MDKQKVSGSLIGVFRPYNHPDHPGVFDENYRLLPDKWHEFCKILHRNRVKRTRIFQANWYLKIGPELWDIYQFNPDIFTDIETMRDIAKKYGVRLVCTICSQTDFHYGRVGPWTHNQYGIRFYDSLERSIALAKYIAVRFGNTIDLEIVNEPTSTGGWNEKQDGQYCFGNSEHKGKTYDELVALKVNTAKFGMAYWLAMMWKTLIDNGIDAKNILFGYEVKFDWDIKLNTFGIRSSVDIVGQAWEIIKWYGFEREHFHSSRYCIHNCGWADENYRGHKFPAGFATEFAVWHFGDKSKNPRKNNIEISDDGKGINVNYSGTGPWPRTPKGHWRVSSKHIFKNSSGGWHIEVLSYINLIEDQLKEIRESYNEVYGIDYEENEYSPIDIPPIIVEKPTEKPTETTTKPSINLKGEWINNKWKIIGGIIAISILILFLMKC
jgi:hypothetical protein